MTLTRQERKLTSSENGFVNGLTLITNTGIDKMKTEYIVIKTEEGDRVVAVGGVIEDEATT